MATSTSNPKVISAEVRTNVQLVGSQVTLPGDLVVQWETNITTYKIHSICQDISCIINWTVRDMVCLSVSARRAPHRLWNMSRLSQPKARQIAVWCGSWLLNYRQSVCCMTIQVARRSHHSYINCHNGTHSPVLVKTPAAVFRQMLSPHSDQGSKAMRSFNISDYSNNHHRWSLQYSDSLYNLLLVQLWKI